MISFGIQIQKEIAIHKRWEALGSIGFDYSYLIRSQGRSIDSQKNIIDFSANEELFKKNHVGLALSIGINYHLNDSFIIGSNIFMQQYLNNWSMEEGLVSRPQAFLLQAGIKYKL